MPYPGRLIIIGRDPGGSHAVLVYAITGRSPSSQARRLKFADQAVWTEPLNMEVLQKGNVDLLIYRAVALGRGIAISNGRQTDEIVQVLNRETEETDPGAILARALRDWIYEPDAPHYTPRISGCLLAGGQAGLSIIRRMADGSAGRSFHSWDPRPGTGRLIATYRGPEENPLPPFGDEPLDVEVREPTAAALAEAAFAALGPDKSGKDYRVAAACVYASIGSFQDFSIHIINRKER
jgi:IMP cyclohydrolase